MDDREPTVPLVRNVDEGTWNLHSADTSYVELTAVGCTLEVNLLKQKRPKKDDSIHTMKGHSMLSGPLSELLASVGTLTTDLLKLLGL